MPGPEHFRNWEEYRKYLAYIHIHDVPHRHHRVVYIGGKPHAVGSKGH